MTPSQTKVTCLIALHGSIAIAIAGHVVASVGVVKRAPPRSSPSKVVGQRCYEMMRHENLALKAPEAMYEAISCHVGVDALHPSPRIARSTAGILDVT